MTPNRQIARQLGLLAMVATAVAILLVAGPACAPAAPGGPASGPVEPDAAAEATATATTAATNTPSTEPSAAAEATSAPTPKIALTDLPSPEPTPTPPVTPDMAKLGMHTGAVVSFLSAPTPAAVAAGDAVSGASGASGVGASAPVIPPITLPPLIDASISTLDLEATRRFLEANGGAITESFQPRGAVNWVISADMPPALLPALSQQPETLHAFVGVLYEKVDNEIGEMVVEYAVKKANNPGTGLGGIEAMVEATPEGYANVRRLLARHNLRLTYPDDFGKRHRFQIIPAGLILPISELPGVAYINRPHIAFPAVLPESQHRPALPAQHAGGVHGALRCAML